MGAAGHVYHAAGPAAMQHAAGTGMHLGAVAGDSSTAGCTRTLALQVSASGMHNASCSMWLVDLLSLSSIHLLRHVHQRAG